MPSEERFAVIRRLLENNGWTLVRVRGSHHVFVKAGQPLLSIPVHHGRVKPVYARQIRKIIEKKD